MGLKLHYSDEDTRVMKMVVQKYGDDGGAMYDEMKSRGSIIILNRKYC